MARTPRDLVVRFVSDVTGFLRGTDQVQDALSDTVKDLDKAADAGERSARDLARAYDRASDSIKRDSREASRATRQAYADAGKEAGDEFAQNLGESVSSGDISGLLSGTVGGLVGTFGKGGPIALALSALAGVGVGAFQAIQAEAERARAAAQTAFDELLDNASNEARLRGFLEERFGTYEEGLSRLARYSDATGIPLAELSDALIQGGKRARYLADEAERVAKALDASGDLSAQREYRSLLTDMADDLNDRADATERAAAAEERRTKALREGVAPLSAQARLYRAGAYGAGGSVWQSQVPGGGRYTTGKRRGGP